MKISPVKLAGTALILAAPFSAVRPLPGTGDFGRNLGFLPLLVALMFGGWRAFTRLLERAADPYSLYLKALIAFFALCAVLAVFNGLQWSYYFAGTSDGGALRAALTKAMAPLMLAATVAMAFQLGSRVFDEDRVQRLVEMSFWAFAAYTLVQIVHPYALSGLYRPLAGLLEGSSSTSDPLGYYAHFGRVNGPTAEPAEFARTLVIYFGPFALADAAGKPSLVKIAAILVGCLLAYSFVGLAAVAVFLVLAAPVLFKSRKGRVALAVGGLVLGAAILAVWDPMSERLSGRAFGTDPSSIIRAHYAWVGLQLIWEHMLLGIGWSSEYLLYPDRVRDLAWLPEVERNLVTLDGLAPKSLILRLTLYAGVPLMVLFVALSVRLAFSRARHQDFHTSIAHRRVVVCLALVGLTGLIDGGIITSFFTWVSLGLVLGLASAACRAGARVHQGSLIVSEGAGHAPATA